MPRGNRMGSQPTPKSEQARLIFGSYGDTQAPKCAEWDPKTETVVQAVLEILAAGSAVMFGTARDGAAISVQIYEGDVKHPRRWLGDAEELDEWAEAIVRAVAIHKGHIA